MGTQIAKNREQQLADRKLVNQSLADIRTRMLTVKDKLFEGAPRHISPNRMITTTLIACRDNPELMTCEPDSLLAAVRSAAFYGWEIGGPLAQCYLVPFNDNKKGTREVQLIPGYRGLIDMMRRSGEIIQIDRELVYECDKFEYQLGDEPKIIHRPSDDPHRLASIITHVYVIVHMKNGAKQRCVWTAAQIDEHKKKFSKGWKRSDSPWNNHWGTMAFKTIIIDMVKRGLVPVSAEIRLAAEREESVSVTSWTEPSAAIAATDPTTIETETVVAETNDVVPEVDDLPEPPPAVDNPAAGDEPPEDLPESPGKKSNQQLFDDKGLPANKEKQDAS